MGQIRLMRPIGPVKTTLPSCGSLVVFQVRNSRVEVLAFFRRRFDPLQVHIQVAQILDRARRAVSRSHTNQHTKRDMHH